MRFFIAEIAYFYIVKLTLSITLIFGIFWAGHAQEKLDSIQQKLDSRLNKVDGITQKLDSLSPQLPTLPDSLLPSFQKLDSIRDGFNKEAFAIKDEYHKSISSIDGEAKKINHKIDSLGSLNLPTKKYTGRLDSLNQLRQKKTADFNSK